MKRSAIRSALPLVLVAAVAVVVLAGRDGAGTDSVPAIRSSPVQQPAGHPASYFGVLRRAAGPADSMPAGVRVQLSTFDVPIGSARAVDVGGPQPGWVLASADQLCLAVPHQTPAKLTGFGVICAPSAVADSEGVADVRIREDAKPGDPIAVFAIVPDGVDQVQVGAGPAARTVRPQGNVLHVDARLGEPVVFSDATGRRHDLVHEGA